MEKNTVYSDLVEKALTVRENAHTPYSGFKVGAAILGESGTIYTGCNIENSSYGMTLCAERAAVAKAVSEGEKSFEAIAVASDTKKLPPCGACRQVLAEFNPGMTVVMATVTGECTVQSLKELFPHPFSKSDIS